MKYIYTNISSYILENKKYLNLNNEFDTDIYQIPFSLFQNEVCIKGSDDYVLCFSNHFVYDYVKDVDIDNYINTDLSNIDISKDWTNYTNGYEHSLTNKHSHILRISKLCQEILNNKPINPISLFFDERSYQCDIKNYIEDGNHRIRAFQYLKYKYFPAFIHGNFSKYLINYLIG